MWFGARWPYSITARLDAIMRLGLAVARIRGDRRGSAPARMCTSARRLRGYVARSRSAPAPIRAVLCTECWGAQGVVIARSEGYFWLYRHQGVVTKSISQHPPRFSQARGTCAIVNGTNSPERARFQNLRRGAEQCSGYTGEC